MKDFKCYMGLSIRDDRLDLMMMRTVTFNLPAIINPIVELCGSIYDWERLPDGDDSKELLKIKYDISHFSRLLSALEEYEHNTHRENWVKAMEETIDNLRKLYKLLGGYCGDNSVHDRCSMYPDHLSNKESEDGGATEGDPSML